MGAFDQARNIGDDEAAIVAQSDHAEVGRQRREGIVGDFRARRRDPRDQRRLAGVGKAHQTDIGQQLQLEAQVLDFARLTGLHLARRAIGGASRSARCRGRRGRPSRPARGRPACARSASSLQRLRRILGLLVDQRAERHGELEVVAGLAGAIRALAVASALGLELGMEPIVDQRVGVRARDDVDRTAVAAVAAARSAARDAESRAGTPGSRARRRRLRRERQPRRRTSGNE